MLWETLERVNRLRQRAMSDPEFVESAKNHEETLKQVEQEFEPKRRRKTKSAKDKKLADIYKQTEFSYNPSGIKH